MTTTVFLVRHAVHSLPDDVLVGRMAGVHLSERGRAQAEFLAHRFARVGLDLVQSSPRERARETAEPIAAEAGVALEIEPAVDEVDFGTWSGRRFDELATDLNWHVWNTARSVGRPPNGEGMKELQNRVVTHLEQLRRQHAGSRIAIVTHAEVIRAALLHYLGRRLEDFGEIEILPATVTTLELNGANAAVGGVNQMAASP